MKTKDKIALNVILSIGHEISAEQIILTPDPKKDGNCLNQLCGLIESAMEEYASQSKWVSVDTMPDAEEFDGEQFICLLEYKLSEPITICGYLKEGKFYNLETKWELENVTKYQYLPTPPIN